MEEKVQKKRGDRFTLIFMALLYGLLSLRYFPGRPGKTIFETAVHFFSIAPVNLGATLIIVSLLQKRTGERLPWGRLLRIFLAVALCVEILVGLALHFQPGTAPPVSG